MQMFDRWRFGALVVCVLGMGCSDDESEPLRVATYNAGLLDSVGYVKERLPLVTQAVTDLDVDVVCMQEVWEQPHWDQLVEANKKQRPNVLRFDPKPGVMDTCTATEFQPVRDCAAMFCSSVPVSGLVPCVMENCGEPIFNLSTGCTNCLLDNAKLGDFDMIGDACVADGTATGGVVPPEKRSYISGGSFGVGLLSSLPFAETDKKELDSSTVRRGILYARLDDTKIGTVHVFCTHLAAILSGLQYQGSYGSWEGENAAHVQALIDWTKEKAGEGGKVIVLGDLNNGPAGNGIKASVPENYALLPAAGFEDPFLSSADAKCTFCSDNPLVQPGDSGADAAIDHILTLGLAGKTKATRIFDQLVEIDTQPPGGGATEKKQVGLSDHYGLRGDISK